MTTIVASAVQSMITFFTPSFSRRLLLTIFSERTNHKYIQLQWLWTQATDTSKNKTMFLIIAVETILRSWFSTHFYRRIRCPQEIKIDVVHSTRSNVSYWVSSSNWESLRIATIKQSNLLYSKLRWQVLKYISIDIVGYRLALSFGAVNLFIYRTFRAIKPYNDNQICWKWALGTSWLQAQLSKNVNRGCQNNWLMSRNVMLSHVAMASSTTQNIWPSLTLHREKRKPRRHEKWKIILAKLLLILTS